MGIGGDDVRLAVDCSSLELPVMVAGIVHLRRKKGKFGICGVLSLLRQIKRKLDRIFVRPASKPNHRRKWVRVLGLTTSGGGWAPGLDQKSNSGLASELGQCSLPGLESGLDQKLSLGLILEPNLVKVPPVVPSKGIFLGVKDGLDLATRGVVPLSSVAGVESSLCLGVLAPSVSEPFSSVCVRKFVTEDVGVTASGDSPTTEASPTIAASIGYDAGDRFGDRNGPADVVTMPVPGFPFPSAEDFLVSFLSKD